MPNPPARFDPYYRWLGIAVEEQPPHYYRLLGLNPLESDPEVIALAADRQMSHIKSLAGGKQAEASQKLLNELAHARVELLNAKRKQAYDHQLRQALSAATPPPLAAGATPPPTPAVPQPADPLAVKNTARVVQARYRKNRRKKTSNAELFLLFGAIALALVGGVIFYLQSQ